MANYVNRDEALDEVELHSETLREAGNKIRNLNFVKSISENDANKIHEDVEAIKKAMSETKGHLIFNPLYNDIEGRLTHIEEIVKEYTNGKNGKE